MAVGLGLSGIGSSLQLEPTGAGLTERKQSRELEWEQGLYRRAFEALKPKLSARQFQVFDLYVRKEWSASEVARAMGMSVAAVYLTKHRVAAALEREVAALQEHLCPARLR